MGKKSSILQKNNGATSIQFCALKRFTYAPKPEQTYIYKSHKHQMWRKKTKKGKL